MDKLDKYRKKIDDIDASILRLVAKRMRVVERVGKFKKRYDLDSVDPDRWEKVINRLKKLSKSTDVLTDEFVEEIWEVIHKKAIRIEDELK